jgi:hypothetical protein
MEQINPKQVKLIELFEKREEAYQQATRGLLDNVSNITEAMTMLIGLPADQIKWVDIEYADTLLVMHIIINYDPCSTPAFVTNFAPPLEDVDRDGEGDIVNIEQLLRIGIPQDLIFAPPTDIVNFFNSLPQQVTTEWAVFDENLLTPEQAEQLKLYEHTMTEAKH